MSGRIPRISRRSQVASHRNEALPASIPRYECAVGQQRRARSYAGARRRASDVEPFTFLAFRLELERRARRQFAALRSPNEDIPAVLLAELAPRSVHLLAAETLLGLDEEGKSRLALDLTERLRASGAMKAGLLMPAYRPAGECLCLLVAASGRCEAVLAAVRRRRRRPPVLDPWSEPAIRVEGLFVDALLAGVAQGCPGCGAAVGQPHCSGCDVERCSSCGNQYILCGCAGHDPSASAWSGEWPGLAECRALGWYARRAAVGWEPCGPEVDGAREDLNRLSFFHEFGFDGLYLAEG